MATKPVTSETKSTKTDASDAASLTKAAAIAAAAPVTPGVVSESKPEIAAPDMKNKELIDAVVERSGIKRRDAKPAVEAALAVIGEALAEGRDLSLPGFGKVKVKRIKSHPKHRILETRIRQGLAGNDSEDDNADGAD